MKTTIIVLWVVLLVAILKMPTPKWYKNIKWLLTEAPTNATVGKEIIHCDYCGIASNEGIGITNYCDAQFKICNACLKKAYDKSLKDNSLGDELEEGK